MSRTLEQVATEYGSVLSSLYSSASGDGLMHLMALETEMAELFLSSGVPLVGLKCKYVWAGEVHQRELTIREVDARDSISAVDGGYGIVADRRNFLFNVNGYYIRLFRD